MSSVSEGEVWFPFLSFFPFLQFLFSLLFRDFSLPYDSIFIFLFCLVLFCFSSFFSCFGQKVLAYRAASFESAALPLSPLITSGGLNTTQTFPPYWGRVDGMELVSHRGRDEQQQKKVGGADHPTPFLGKKPFSGEKQKVGTRSYT